MHFLSAIFTFLVSPLTALLFILLPSLCVALNSSLLTMISFSHCFPIVFENLIFSHSPDNVIDHAEHLKQCFGWWSQCNPFYSNQNSLHYIRQRHHPSVHFSFLRNGYNRGKGKNLYSHQISLATVNNRYFHLKYEEMAMRRQSIRGVMTRNDRRKGYLKRQ